MTLAVDHQGFTVYHIVHAAETYALAVLENLVHFNSTQLPPHMVVIRIDIPAALACTRLSPFEDNLVIDPAHPDARRLTVHEPVLALIDERLSS